MMKFTNLLSKTCLSDINVVDKFDAATEFIRLYSFNLQAIYTYSAETRLATGNKIHVW
jgi:hypothetical protein